jgi:hypothetical protein
MKISISAPVGMDATKFEFKDGVLSVDPAFFKGEPRAVLATVAYEVGGEKRTYLLQISSRTGDLSIVDRTKPIQPLFGKGAKK